MQHTLPSARRRSLLAAGLGMALIPAMAAPAPAQARGTLAIIGGALRADNGEVWTRLVELAGGPGAPIAVMPSAAEHPERAGRQIAAALQRYGAAPFVVPVAQRWPGSDARQAADDAALAERVRAAGGVFFAGGDQARITHALRRADGSRSAVLDAIWDVYRSGGMVAGTSAGAAIMSSTMFYQAPDLLAGLRGGLHEPRALAPGLGFIGDQVLIDQHFLVRGRFARMLPGLFRGGYRLGLGIDENSAVLVSGGEAEVIGYKGALVIDVSQASGWQPDGPFQVRNALLSYLDRGDRYHLGTAAYVPAPDREVLAAAPAALAPPLYSNDILANNAVVELMERLVRSPHLDALGIASGDPRDTAWFGKGRGFAFNFRKTAGTRAYESASGALSVIGVSLDVQTYEACGDPQRCQKS